MSCQNCQYGQKDGSGNGDGDCKSCSIDYPSAEEMRSDDKKENRKNLIFYIITVICMIVFVIIVGTLMKKVAPDVIGYEEPDTYVVSIEETETV